MVTDLTKRVGRAYWGKEWERQLNERPIELTFQITREELRWLEGRRHKSGVEAAAHELITEGLRVEQEAREKIDRMGYGIFEVA